jgi:DNA-binding Lrp family transcriptional regulator|tara:strand:- start:7459 stop:7941 length:483 start_codon:yes stop_codon:yes gene_type:complete
LAKPTSLDAIDLKILKVLQRQGRVTNQKLAALVALSPSPCLQRVRKLEQAGVITAYGATLQLEKICRSVTVIATVTLRSHEEQDFRNFEAAMAGIAEVIECLKVSGSFDYFLRFVCADISRYHSLSDDLLRESHAIANLSSHVVLDPTKPLNPLPLDALL